MKPSRRIAVACAALAAAGCVSWGQSAYDERAEAECEGLPGIEAQRECLNDLEDEQNRRNIPPRTP